MDWLWARMGTGAFGMEAEGEGMCGTGVEEAEGQQ